MRTQLAIRTEYSFRWAYGPIEKVVQRLKQLGCETAAITDRNSTYGHVNWTKYCKKYGIKPIYGVELGFVEDINAKGRRQNVFWLPLLARNNDGLREIYAAVEEATHNFYYFPRLPFKKLNDISKNVIIFTGNSGLGQRARLGRNVLGSGHPATANAILKDRTVIPVSDNYMITHEDKSIYEILAGRNTNDRPSPTYILDEWMLRLEMDWLDDEHFNLANKIGAECDAQIQIAPNIKYKSNMSLLDMCLIGARERELELTSEYMERLNKELGLIVEKGFEDYFYVIADMVTYAKKHMLVGPARGSSCGSLVCYLLGITDVDPIPFGLIFERFIDITRSDLPDIDIDFQDNRRDMVFEYIRDKYGADCVAHLGTVSRYKPKSAIGESAKALGIPEWEIKDLKDSILKRSGGDSRAKYCIMDTFQELEIGQRFIEKYPQMKIAGDLEGHARHTGKHAAAIIISNKPLNNYTAFDVKNNTIHIDKFDTEYLNMMKIDALGLKTLTILRETMDEVGWTHKDLLKHPLDDDKAFEVLRKHLFCGIFQYEGQALQTLARRFYIDQFNDVAILTALARPGPFASGASAQWIECRNGRQEPKFVHPSMISYTTETYGIIIYQEQVMRCVREIGQFSWGDTSEIRKAISKSLGIEYFDRYWQKFKEGAASQGIDETYAKTMWDNINTMGCLSGDTIIKNPFPNHVTPKQYTLAELYEREKVFNEDPRYRMMKPQQIYCFNGEVLVPMRNIKVWQSGIKTTYKLILSSGETIRATKDHKFLTIDGNFVALSELNVGDMIMVGGNTRISKRHLSKGTGSGAHNWRAKKEELGDNYVTWARARHIHLTNYPICEICNIKPTEDIHHLNENRSDNRQENLQSVCKSCHKYIHKVAPHTVGKQIKPAIIIFIGDSKEEMTYDISMPDPHNNYLANNIIVHNSWAFNHSHAIAYGMLSYWCCVLKAHFPVEFALATIRNTGDPDSIKRYLRELDRTGYEIKAYDLESSEKSWSFKDNTFIGGLLNIKGVGYKKADNILLARALGQEPKFPDEITTPYDNLFEGRTRFADVINDPLKYNIVRNPRSDLIDVDEDYQGDITFMAKIVHRNERSLNETMFLAQRDGVRVPNDKWLNLTLEDDTSSVIATVSRYSFPSLGLKLINDYRLGSWFIWGGYVNKGRRIYIKKFRYLG